MIRHQPLEESEPTAPPVYDPEDTAPPVTTQPTAPEMPPPSYEEATANKI